MTSPASCWWNLTGTTQNRACIPFWSCASLAGFASGSRRRTDYMLVIMTPGVLQGGCFAHCQGAGVANAGAQRCGVACAAVHQKQLLRPGSKQQVRRRLPLRVGFVKSAMQCRYACGVAGIGCWERRTAAGACAAVEFCHTLRLCSNQALLTVLRRVSDERFTERFIAD